MAAEKDFSAIYGRLFNQLAPYANPAPWQDVPAPDDVRLPVADPAAVVEDMLSVHTQSELVEACVLTFESDDDPQLNPALCGEGTVIIALRNGEDHDPFELLAGGATLSGRMLPLCAVLRDAGIRQMHKQAKDKVLCLSSSPADVALLLSLDIPATFDTGMNQLGGAYLQQVRLDFKLDPPKPDIFASMLYDPEGNDRARAKGPPGLMYVACSLANLSAEEPAAVAPVISHLAALEKHLSLCMDAFYRWQPTLAEIEHIKFCLDYTDIQEAKVAITDGFADAEHLVPVPKAASASAADSQSLADAARELDQLRAKPERDLTAERRAWATMQRILKERCVRPMFEAAEATGDPIESNYWLMAAMGGQAHYPQMARLMQNRSTPEKKTNPGKLTAYPDPEFKQAMAAIDRQLKIFKGIVDRQKDPPVNWP